MNVSLLCVYTEGVPAGRWKDTDGVRHNPPPIPLEEHSGREEHKG